MSRIFFSDLGRTLSGIVAALLLSTTFITAAVGPAHVTVAPTTELTA